MPHASRAARFQIAAALLAVYLVWGSTYLGVRIALVAFPPLTLVGLRYGAAGVILYAVLRARGEKAPSPRDWLRLAGVGALLATSSAATAIALRDVPTGVAAVACGSIPLWSALFGRAWGERTTRLEWAGLACGFSGVVLLNGQGELRAHAFSALALWAGSAAWAFASVVSPRLRLPKGAMSSAGQMIAGGAAVLAAAAVRGERLRGVPSGAALASLGYLVVVGSIVAFSAYVFLLGRVRTSVATSYAYVNPVVALALGCAIQHEPLTRATIYASLAILGGVAILAVPARSRAPVAAPAPESRARPSEAPSPG